MSDKTLAFTFILIFIFFVGTSASKADTKIYKHVDKDGKVTFSNKRIKGANDITVVPSTPKLNANKTKNNNQFPKVSNNTQKARDIKRRRILEHELETESKLLANAKQMLTKTIENSSDISSASIKQTQQDTIRQKNKIKMIQKRLLLHEKNIGALKKELASL